MHKVTLFDARGKKSDFVQFDKEAFDGNFSEALLYQAVNMYRANMRKGNASTKTRGDVRGGGKKPWRQKGTGRARFGSIRNPIWRGGGIAFGPHPRDFSYALPRKMRKKALLASLNAKLADGEIFAVDEPGIKEPKTRQLSKLLEAMKLKPRVLFLVNDADKNLLLAARNIKNLKLKQVGDATAFDVLSCDNVLVTKQAAIKLNEAFKK